MLQLFKGILFSFILSMVILPCQLSSQGLLLHSNSEHLRTLNRYDILGYHFGYGTALRWYDGIVTMSALDSVTCDVRGAFIQFLPEEQRVSLLRPIRENLWSHFYQNSHYIYQKYDNTYYLQINPLMHLQAQQSDELNQQFVNARGIQVRAGLGKRLHLVTDLLEIQRGFPGYLQDFVNENSAIPGVVFYKNFSSSIIDLTGAYDYNIAQAILQVQAADFLDISIGHGKNFIGYGRRSLLLGDWTAPYFHLKLNTHIGKFHYQNIFAELQAESNRDRSGDQLLTKKYMVSHYLSYAFSDHFEMGLIETVVFSRENQFELQYLNPIIFYRSLEQALGSSDNIIMGLNVKWDVFDKIRLYGQYTFDEFVFNELFIERRGWWANKWGIQAGVQWVDPFKIKESVLRAEFNYVRPFTFQHRDSISNYTHAKQSLAHPSGANFYEFLLSYHWELNEKWRIAATANVIRKGYDPDELSNFGGNVNKPTSTRVQNFENEVLQGDATDRIYADINISRKLWNGLWLDANVRNNQSTRMIRTDLNRDFWYFGLGIRWNMPYNPLFL